MYQCRQGKQNAVRTEKRPILEYLPEFSTSKEEGGLNGGLRTE
jgi:hypothetical protein